MTRRLIDYKKLDHQLATLLLDTYPHGYGDEDIIAFRNGSGDIVEAVELRTSDTLYLVKISQSLSNFIANFEENIEKELQSNTPSDAMVSEQITPEMEMGFTTEEEEFNDSE